ncbi:hypothetical protein SQ03_14900 [Methylobacterium platani JCM 14648]|uniref:Uncharacterized protein n=2 Tax=Methylobacterium platani TaxID=427683 RepID=A0A179SAT8_9HYPH|nr:hypothetical protein SQ03_14900 [Methylobacterium platani JCM 14648]OAS24731.1 hypothetical protein A5481_13460 [Methylobacterium platani]
MDVTSPGSLAKRFQAPQQASTICLSSRNTRLASLFWRRYCQTSPIGFDSGDEAGRGRCAGRLGIDVSMPRREGLVEKSTISNMETGRASIPRFRGEARPDLLIYRPR